MPVADGLLAPGMCRDAFDGKIDLDQAFGILLCHVLSIVLYPIAPSRMAWGFAK
ncbi:MAG: hypothetical protein JWQ49_3588 [Edaphobacter sp.]|nr:hypothetical protein [Edaphobacter sp.]